MKMATLAQRKTVVDRLLEANASVEEVNQLLARWNYVQALMRAEGEIPDIETFQFFLAGELEITAPVSPETWNVIWYDATDENWLDRLVAREAAVHEARGTRWQCERFIEIAKKHGRQQIEKWEGKFLLRFSALPILDLSPDAEHSWWQVKPNAWYYEQARAGKIGHLINGDFQPDLEPWKLRGEIVLIDTRLKPRYTDGRQKWQSDELFCGQVLKQLRKAGTVPNYGHGSQLSRFGVNANPDWQDHIQPALAKLLGLYLTQVRLERAIEGNFIPQFYSDFPRTQDGTTNTWVWYEEMFAGGPDRFFGGRSDYGGLAAVVGHWPGDRWGGRSFRPLGVFS